MSYYTGGGNSIIIQIGMVCCRGVSELSKLLQLTDRQRQTDILLVYITRYNCK